MDVNIMLWFQGLRSSLLNALGYGITVLAEDAVLLLVICALYWCFSKRTALYVIFSYLSGMLFNSFLKVGFCVARPWLRDSRIVPYEKAIPTATGFSFPSGHMACATAVYGGFALLLWDRKRWASWLMLLLALLIGVSRVYLGVHTPQDVVVSLAAGVILLFVVRAAMRGLDKRPERDVWVLAACLAGALALLLYTHLKPYPEGTDRELLQDSYKTAGALAGMGVGWFLERRFVLFDTHAAWWLQAVKLACGILGILAMRSLLKSVCIALVGAEFGGALRYCLILLWAIWLWPLLFSRLQKATERA